MIVLELVCLAIVGLFLAFRGRGRLKQLAMLALASVIAEDTVIRAYGFYEYSPKWSLFIDKVPLMIALIWPVVIVSAYELAKYVRGPRPLITAAIVLFDASLIEPIAVRAGLWWWNEPGLFGVPPIGIFGWAVFAFFAVQKVWLAPIAAHAVLVASWWAFFRWVNVELPVWPPVLVLWVLSIVLAVRVRPAIPRSELYLRVPAALFFFVMLAIHGRSDLALVSWAIAFAPPYLAQFRA
jgi:hypothetical protein